MLHTYFRGKEVGINLVKSSQIIMSCMLWSWLLSLLGHNKYNCYKTTHAIAQTKKNKKIFNEYLLEISTAPSKARM